MRINGNPHAQDRGPLLVVKFPLLFHPPLKFVDRRTGRRPRRPGGRGNDKEGLLLRPFEIGTRLVWFAKFFIEFGSSAVKTLDQVFNVLFVDITL